MSGEFEKRMARIDQEIEIGRSWRGRLRNFVKKSGTIAGLGLFGLALAKAPVFAFIFLGAGVVTIAAAVAYFINESSLNKKYQEQQGDMKVALKGSASAPSSSMKPGIKLGDQFENAAAIEKLAQDVEDLKKEIKGHPVILDKPKRL